MNNLEIINKKKQKFTIFFDEEDYQKIKKHTWRVNYTNGEKYLPYVGTRILGKQISLHRFILNPEKGKVVDHINGNPLDNRRNNLRICTQEENIRNQKIYNHHSTGYKGVQIVKNTIRARIYCNSKLVHLGTFATLIEAAKAYDIAAKKYFGNFAHLNFQNP